MSRVSSSPIPPGSRLFPRIGAGDFHDCYRVAAQTTPRAAAEIITAFPGWARGLLTLRNLLTVPFGLSGGAAPGTDKIGPFPVIDEDAEEILAGFDDRHLNFAISVMARDGQITLATWVHPHNFAGRAYLAAIMPFHILIARDALARVAKKTSRPAKD